jgi:hypothetical protein
MANRLTGKTVALSRHPRSGTTQQTTAQQRAPPVSPLPKSVSCAPSNPHAPRLRFPCALPRPHFSIFVRRRDTLTRPSEPQSPLRQSFVVYLRRMAPKKTTLEELADMLAHVVKHMATKDDIADLRREMATKDDLAASETRLDRRIEKLDTKLTKFEEHQIDKRKQLEVRVSAIEKHLGLDKKSAA